VRLTGTVHDAPYHGGMRVIGGTYRSRLLQAPAGWGTRPTSDRLRETLFNILSPRLPGCRFADLYAGTGAVGIEAISRGAAFCWFAERDVAAIKTLRGNLQSLKIAQGYALEDRGTAALLERLGKSTAGLDVVFLDPPYEDAEAYASTLGFFGGKGRGVLVPEAIVIAEHATRAKTPLLDRYGALHLQRTVKQGDASLSFYIPADPGTV
jgi:16S rRNA (guanine966-N2)-methyltransferase